MIPFWNKEKHHSQNLQTGQTQDILKLIYSTLNYDIIINDLTFYLESSASRESEKGKISYSRCQKSGDHFVKNYRKTHESIVQRDLHNFIPQTIEIKIKEILNEGERKLKSLLKIAPVEIIAN